MNSASHLHHQVQLAYVFVTIDLAKLLFYSIWNVLGDTSYGRYVCHFASVEQVICDFFGVQNHMWLPGLRLV